MATSLDPEAQKREANMEVIRREMERRSLDTIRIYNPLERSFRYMFNSYWHQVPAKSTKDEPRFLAHHFFKKIADFMIGEQMISKGDELLKLREKQLGKSYIDKYEENIEVWNKTPRLDDPELLKQIKDVVIVGLVEEYGLEVPDVPNEPPQKIDYRSLHDQIFDSEDKIVSRDVERLENEVHTSAETTYPINRSKTIKKDLANEVTVK